MMSKICPILKDNCLGELCAWFDGVYDDKCCILQIMLRFMETTDDREETENEL